MKNIVVVGLVMIISQNSAIWLTGCKGEQTRTEKIASRSGDSGVRPPQSAPAAAGSDSAVRVMTYTFRGTPVAVDAKGRRITIDHNGIEGYMEAMTMPFAVVDPSLLTRVQVGEEALFTIRVTGDQAVVTEVK